MESEVKLINPPNDLTHDVAAYNRILESKKKWAANHKDELREYNRRYKLHKRLGGDVYKISKEIEKRESDLKILREFLKEADQTPRQLSLVINANKSIMTTTGGDGDVLLLITSMICCHCKSLKSLWNDVELDIIREHPTIKIIKIDLPDNTGDNLPDGIFLPKFLFMWFPMVAFITKQRWNDSRLKDGMLVLNADLANERLTYSEKYQMKPSGIKQWMTYAYNYFQTR